MRSVPVILLRVAALVALAFTAATVVEYYVSPATFCEPDGGCEAVRISVIGRAIGRFLPALGLLVFPLLFAGSLVRHRDTLRWTGLLAIAAGIGGAGFIALQVFGIGSLCWLCVGVDSAAIVAGIAGAWIVRGRVGEEDGSASLKSAWWPLFFFAFSPIAWTLTFPDPSSVPEGVRELWDGGADVNVVELADFECPYCRAMHPALKSALESSDADVHLARVIVPLEIHPRARPAAAAYFCAVEMGQGDAMADRLFEGELTDAAIAEHAAALDLDADAFSSCLRADRTDERIEADYDRYRALETRGLPQVYVGERLLLGFHAQDGDAPYRAALADALEGESRRVRYWPFAILAVLTLLSLALSFYRRREPPPSP